MERRKKDLTTCRTLSMPNGGRSLTLNMSNGRTQLKVSAFIYIYIYIDWLEDIILSFCYKYLRGSI